MSDASMTVAMKMAMVATCNAVKATVRARTPVFGLIGIRMVIRDMVANVDASESRCRCIGKIIARDLRLVASRLYRMAVTRPWVTCRRYIIPLFRRRPPGLHKLYNREGKEREERIIQSCRVRTRTKSKVPLPIGTVR